MRLSISTLLCGAAWLWFGIFSGLDAANINRPAGLEATPAVVNPAVRSELRPMLSLDGQWDFATDAKLQGESQRWFLPKTSLPKPRKIKVPGCWEAQGVGEPGLSNATPGLAYEPVNVMLRSAYTGAAWYKREFTVPGDWAGKRIWLKIGGVNAQGWFWLGGTYVGHEWTYCGSYKYDVTDLVTPGSKAVLAILARNDLPSRRGEMNCVRPFGGVFRSVELDATPPVLVDNAFVEPLLDKKTARVHVSLRNTTGAAAESYTVAVRVATVVGEQVAGQASRKVSIGADAVTTLTLDVALDPCTPWSPENPFLYTASVVLGKSGQPIDGWVERFGVKKYEAKEADLYLNNRRYYLRGCGDDHVYPMTVCTPASREEHVRHLKIAKQYGFNYVRHHTHCEIPEFFEAADEVGMMVQPELPYYGCQSHMSCGPVAPKEDLAELVAHRRRYTSLATYVGGNERTCPTPLDEELYRLAKRLDPSRPWVCLDGGTNNSPRNSDVNNWWGGGAQVHPPLKENDFPRVLHEYMSLGINEDPRLEPKFSGAFLPNRPLAEVKKYVTEEVGLDWKWAEACFDAGHRIQAVHHKIGIETARFDKFLDGFSCWLMIDISPSSQNGVLDMYWGRKWSTPEHFRQFNSPTVLLACVVKGDSNEPLSLRPASANHVEGDLLEIDWLVSHFQDRPIAGGTLAWHLDAGDKRLAEGKVDKVNVAAGQVSIVGRSRITMPKVPKPVLATLRVELPDAQSSNLSSNSWKIRIFPKLVSEPASGNDLAASGSVYKMLARRYPGVGRLGSPEAAARPVVVAGSLMDEGVLQALGQGKRVVCLSLPKFDSLRPGTRLGWWSITNQTGTAIASHPAWGDFPHEGHLDGGMFRLVELAEKLDPGHKFRAVEPLMVGIGRAKGYSWGTAGYPLGFNLYVFQAKVGPGKLLASGLRLKQDAPEAVGLLDQFIRYARSEEFQPKGAFDAAELEKQVEKLRELAGNLNGWSTTLKASETTEWHTFLRTAPMYTVRQTDGRSELVWKTGPWKPDADGKIRFRWIANLGWQSQPAGGHFTMYLENDKLFDFDITLKSTAWKSADGSVELHYTVRSLDKKEDSSGIMELVVPATKLTPGGQPIRLRVTGSANKSRRYFGLQENP